MNLNGIHPHMQYAFRYPKSKSLDISILIFLTKIYDKTFYLKQDVDIYLYLSILTLNVSSLLGPALRAINWCSSGLEPGAGNLASRCCCCLDTSQLTFPICQPPNTRKAATTAFLWRCNRQKMHVFHFQSM